MTYTVEVKETISKKIEVIADSPEEARATAKQLFDSGTYDNDEGYLEGSFCPARFSVYDNNMEPLIEDAEHSYVWQDLVCINGKVTAEAFPVSGLAEDEEEGIYQIDDFFESCAKKYHCNVDDIRTYMMDGEDFCGDAECNVQELPFGAESCGMCIDGLLQFV